MRGERFGSYGRGTRDEKSQQRQGTRGARAGGVARSVRHEAWDEAKGRGSGSGFGSGSSFRTPDDWARSEEVKVGMKVYKGESASERAN